MPHPIHCALTLAGPITELVADLRKHPNVRQEKLLPQANDDHAQCMCKFANGANGFIVASRVAHGKRWGSAMKFTARKGRYNLIKRIKIAYTSTELVKILDSSESWQALARELCNVWPGAWPRYGLPRPDHH